MKILPNQLATKSIKIFLILLLILAIFTPHMPIPPVNIDDHHKESDNSKHADITKINALQIPFIKNLGQVNSDKVKFYAKTFAGTVFITEDDLTYSFYKGTTPSQRLAIKERFVDGSLQPLGVEKASSVVNYFVGEKENWRTNIPTFQTISLGSVWPSIDVCVMVHSNNLE